MVSNAERDFEKPAVPTNPNYHRLSAMIEDYNALGESDGEEEDIFVPITRPVNGQDSRSENSLPHSNPIITLTSSHGSAPSSMERNINGFSPGNRESIISSYSGTVHEGVPISYVVTSQVGSTVNKEPMNEPALPPLPMTKKWQPNGNDGDSRTVSTGLGIVTNGLTSPSASNNKAEVGTSSSTYVDNNESLRLLSIENPRQKGPPSIGSGNLASESEHSHNYSNVSNSISSYADMDTNNNGDSKRTRLSPVGSVIREESYEEQRTISARGLSSSKNSSLREGDNKVHDTSLNLSKAPSENDIVTVSDSKSIVSSILPELETKMEDVAIGKDASMEIISEFHPTVPPRSNRRPRSSIFIKESLDDIQDQLAKEMQKGEGSRKSSYSIHSDGFYSATEHDAEKKGQNIKTEENVEDEEYVARPLPSIPNTEQTPVHKNVDADDDFEDIIDEDEEGTAEKAASRPTDPPLKMPRSKLPRTPKSGRAKSKSKRDAGSKRSKELRSFDIDTIAQLLNVTKGTLIGSEFANLGMKIEEKRALERLVDSLSRLTADMVLDPEKFTEGLKRLDRATRALDGF